MTRPTERWPGVLTSTEFDRVQGRDARAANVAAGTALADAVRTTLGPRGMDKMLVDAEGEVLVTNDGAHVLRRMDVAHPAAAMLVAVAESQESATGDGTTTAVMLAGALLEEAADLLEGGLHPTSVTDGYRRAATRARGVLEDLATTVDPTDTDRLGELAETAITGKWDGPARRVLADLAVEAVRAVETGGTVDRSRLVRKALPGGSVADSALVEGLAIDLETSSTSLASHELPRGLEDVTVALVDDQITVETATGQGTVGLEGYDDLQALVRYEDDVHAGYLDRFREIGADVVFCQKEIDDAVTLGLAREGVLALERTRQDEIDNLARVTGAELVPTVDALSPASTGRAGRVERRALGGTDLLVVRDCPNANPVSVVLRGGPRHVVEEADRVLEDCLDVLELILAERTVLPGGGAPELEVARELRGFADSIEGRDQLAVRAFADAVEVIPRTLAESAGLDPVDAIVDLGARHHDGQRTVGLDARSGEPRDMYEAGVLEPLAVKRAAVESAREAAHALLRVDDVIAAKGDGSADGHDHGHDHDHETGLQSGGGSYPWAIGH